MSKQRTDQGQYTTDPASANSRILGWFRDHPGYHRCVTAAQELGLRTHPVAVAAYAASNKGLLLRSRGDVSTGKKGRTKTMTLYAWNPEGPST